MKRLITRVCALMGILSAAVSADVVRSMIPEELTWSRTLASRLRASR